MLKNNKLNNKKYEKTFKKSIEGWIQTQSFPKLVLYMNPKKNLLVEVLILKFLPPDPVQPKKTDPTLIQIKKYCPICDNCYSGIFLNENVSLKLEIVD